MDMSFIVRQSCELKAVGAEIFRAACSIEWIREILGGLKQRRRFYDATTTWLMFLGQTLSPDRSCRNAVAQARASGLLSARASVHTGAYCQARERLPEEALHSIAAKLGAELMNAERAEDRWHGRRVMAVDGSSVSLPDTAANQAKYPQPSAQAAGCGFPVMYVCTLMSLGSGALLDFAIGGGAGNELALWRQLCPLLRPGDIILGDGLYCGYADLVLLKARGVDVVMRLKRRKTDFRKGRILGVLDHLTVWHCPKQPPTWLGKQLLPAELSVRELRFRVEVPGFRTETVTLVTTLTDAEAYSKEDLAGLFFQRWQVELRLRDIKITLGMDQLRTTTPIRVRKELWMHLAGYNVLRILMYAAAQKARVPVARISFQGCRQRLLAAATHSGTARVFRRLYRRLILDMAKDPNPDRPFRIEPRAIKRRLKQYDLMIRPRAVMRQELMKIA